MRMLAGGDDDRSVDATIYGGTRAGGGGDWLGLPNWVVTASLRHRSTTSETQNNTDQERVAPPGSRRERQGEKYRMTQ